MKALYWDMDGTIYDFYNTEGYVEMLENEELTPYTCGGTLCDMQALNDLMKKFIKQGFTIGVISWTARNGSKEYNSRVRKVKREWIKKNLPCATEIHVVKYGTPKHKVAKIKDAILIDDDARVRAQWEKTNNPTIDATKDILKELEKILPKAA
jgi:hypothetical protein